MWLTSLPIEEFSFHLHKGAFIDALALRYGWDPVRTPLSCACSTSFSISHALSFPKGGFPSIRHNEKETWLLVFSQMSATMLRSNQCYNLFQVKLYPEPPRIMLTVPCWTLQWMVSGEKDMKRTFLNIRVLILTALPLELVTFLYSSYVKHERKKESLWTVSTRGRAHFIYSNCLVSNRRYDQTSHKILQMTPNAPSSHLKTLALSSAILHTGDWLNLVPSLALGLHFHDQEFCQCLQYWLSVKMFSIGYPCSFCKSTLWWSSN